MAKVRTMVDQLQWHCTNNLELSAAKKETCPWLAFCIHLTAGHLKVLDTQFWP